ncbi:MAG: hypothetical protein SOZ34_04515 [Clostridia bacterium]|nr:hypothetical protein [Clostridia bacterium]
MSFFKKKSVKKKKKIGTFYYMYVNLGLIYSALGVLGLYNGSEEYLEVLGVTSILAFVYGIWRITVSILFILKKPIAYKMNLVSFILCIVNRVSQVVKLSISYGYEYLEIGLCSISITVIVIAFSYIYFRNRKDLLESGNY